MLSVHADPDRAHTLFEQALAAARELGDDWVVARTLLTAAWEPYWRDDIEGARKMFGEALEVARINPEGDSWAEARALTSLASIISAIADEQECLELAEEALELGRRMGDAFTMAVAQERLGSSLRRMWRLEDALAPLSEAVRAFRDLGARWEVASVLGERGHVYRQLRRFQEAEHDIREALDILRDLKERSLIAWTASEHIRVVLSRGQVEGARRAFQELSEELASEEPGVTSYVQRLSALLALAEDDRDAALKYALEMLEIERSRPYRNSVAAVVWWVAVVFGPEVVGGSEAAEEARRTLENAHWIEALREPELVAQGRY
jgi:tetratricopeptide (TPR) repeat protein